MFAASVEPGRITLVLSIGEMRLLNNALNEVVNVVEIPTTAFETRMGGTREEVNHLLVSVHAVLDSAEMVQPKSSEQPS
jgi:hypothetical protein